ncbi:MAG: amidohydrolase family protein, partial [Pirellulales bacterium]
MTIDAHQHFWRYSPAEYPWIGPGMERLARDYLPADLEAVAGPLQVTGSIVVQARQSLAESRWLLELAATHPFIRGVVGWVDLRCDTVADDLAPLAVEQNFVGVRHVVQDEPDPRFLLRDDFLRGLHTLHQFGLTYDLLVFPHQLPAAVELAGRLPEQPFVLDHLAKPPVKTGMLAGWEKDLRALARHDNVCCKLSGLVTEADWNDWQPDDFSRYFEVALEAFGPHRLMAGSDWPVCLLAAEYAEVWDILDRAIAQLSATEQAAPNGGLF